MPIWAHQPLRQPLQRVVLLAVQAGRHVDDAAGGMEELEARQPLDDHAIGRVVPEQVQLGDARRGRGRAAPRRLRAPRELPVDGLQVLARVAPGVVDGVPCSSRAPAPAGAGGRGTLPRC